MTYLGGERFVEYKGPWGAAGWDGMIACASSIAAQFEGDEWPSAEARFATERGVNHDALYIVRHCLHCVADGNECECHPAYVPQGMETIGLPSVGQAQLLLDGLHALVPLLTEGNRTGLLRAIGTIWIRCAPKGAKVSDHRRYSVARYFDYQRGHWLDEFEGWYLVEAAAELLDKVGRRTFVKIIDPAEVFAIYRRVGVGTDFAAVWWQINQDLGPIRVRGRPIVRRLLWRLGRRIRRQPV